MEVKLRGLDRYEVEAIQYDGTNSDEICQRENQSSIQLVWERYTTGSRSNYSTERMLRTVLRYTINSKK